MNMVGQQQQQFGQNASSGYYNNNQGGNINQTHQNTVGLNSSPMLSNQTNNGNKIASIGSPTGTNKKGKLSFM